MREYNTTDFIKQKNTKNSKIIIKNDPTEEDVVRIIDMLIKSGFRQYLELADQSEQRYNEPNLK